MTVDVDVIARAVGVAGMDVSQNAICTRMLPAGAVFYDVGAVQVAYAREQRNGMSAAGFDDRLPCNKRNERRSASWLRWDSRHAFIERVC